MIIILGLIPFSLCVYVCLCDDDSHETQLFKPPPECFTVYILYIGHLRPAVTTNRIQKYRFPKKIMVLNRKYDTDL